MTNHGLADINLEPENYRGRRVLTQEHWYKMTAMTVDIAPEEQTHITNHAHRLLTSEEAEHLQGVDQYQSQILLTIETPAGCKEAWYTIHADDIIAEQSLMKMTIVRSDESAS